VSILDGQAGWRASLPGNTQGVCPSCDGKSHPASSLGLCGACLLASYRDGCALVESADAAQAAQVLADERVAHDAKVVKRGLPATNNRAGYIYFFVADSGLVKIGFSQDPNRRVKQFGDGALIATIPGYLSTERAVHRRFEHLRCSGEWYEPDQELLDYIEALRAEQDAAA
jgi:hypothetical protein